MNTNRLPATGQDVFNYLASYYASNHQLQLVLSFLDQLDLDILKKALRLTLELEPILGCRFVEDPQKSYWERREDLDRIELCKFICTDQPDDVLHEFTSLPLDSRKDPLVQAMLIRTEQEDVLCLKLDHACIDGGGIKAYIALLAEVYTNIIENCTITKLPTQLCRDGMGFLREFGINDPLQAFDPSQASHSSNWGFPSAHYRCQYPTYIRRKLVNFELSTLKEYCNQNEATINDLLLAAYYHALFRITHAQANDPKPLMVTIDLRRLIPGEDKIIAANISSSFVTLLENITDEPFDLMLQRISRMMKDFKQNHAEIAVAVIMEVFGMIDFRDVQAWYHQSRQDSLQTNYADPLFSNIGVIAPLAFGKNTVNDAYIITPAMFAPSLMLGISTYNQIPSLVVHYYSSDIEKDDVDSLLDGMISILNETVSSY